MKPLTGIFSNGYGKTRTLCIFGVPNPHNRHVHSFFCTLTLAFPSTGATVCGLEAHGPLAGPSLDHADSSDLTLCILQGKHRGGGSLPASALSYDLSGKCEDPSAVLQPFTHHDTQPPVDRDFLPLRLPLLLIPLSGFRVVPTDNEPPSPWPVCFHRGELFPFACNVGTHVDQYLLISQGSKHNQQPLSGCIGHDKCIGTADLHHCHL